MPSAHLILEKIKQIPKINTPNRSLPWQPQHVTPKFGYPPDFKGIERKPLTTETDYTATVNESSLRVTAR
jgi:hypothetical protein